MFQTKGLVTTDMLLGIKGRWGKSKI